MRAALVPEPGWEAAVPLAAAAGADIICLPLLSFSSYVASDLDRGSYQEAERAPSATWSRAVELAGGAWLAASPYESEGEGVFYLSGRVGRLGSSENLLWRQSLPESAEGRYETMFWSPGHGSVETITVEGWEAALMLGGELRDPASWAAVVDAGASLVLGASAETADLWAETARIANQMATRNRIAVMIVNRSAQESGPDFAGGALALSPAGEPIVESAPGIFDLPARATS